jgi:hypothetical protein
VVATPAAPFLDAGAADGGPGGALLIAALAESGLTATIAFGPGETPAAGAAPAWDLSLAPARPDCGAPGLSAESAAACAAFIWSAPLWEIVVVYLTRAPDAAAATVGSLREGPVCASPAAPLALLERRGLSPAAGGLTVAAAPDCVAAVAGGRATAAAVTAAEADAALAADPAGAVAEAYALTQAAAVHVVAPAASPSAEADIAALDAGLAALRARGAWFALLRDGLAN